MVDIRLWIVKDFFSGSGGGDSVAASSQEDQRAKFLAVKSSLNLLDTLDLMSCIGGWPKKRLY